MNIMSVTDAMPRTDPIRVQPKPSAVARVVHTGGIGIARDRLRVRSGYGDRYRGALAVAARALPASRGPRTGRHDDRFRVLADLAAVHLYLTGGWAELDDALPRGTAGAHLPLARCVASGLHRLRSYRGPAVARARVDGPAADWYRENRFVTERGFWTASASTAALREGGPGFVVWSLTGRRTATVDPYADDRLAFLPGTRFKVLRVTEGRWPTVLMRELFAEEPGTGPDRPGGSGRGHTPWLDETTLSELERVVGGPGAEGVAVPVPALWADPYGRGPTARLPGLMVGEA
ncbi:hypothetical protein ACFWBB_10605 [Streptomyces sp. NPDC060000]|uniref:hypothetical protein n=1 Tax=Streptomyces sp. NPDC060000 TaxID=3347031 RepID=UPI0036ACBEFC